MPAIHIHVFVGVLSHLDELVSNHTLSFSPRIKFEKEVQILINALLLMVDIFRKILRHESKCRH